MIIDFIAGIIAGILGSMGFGGGGIMILYLTLFKDISQLKAQGMNLLFFIPTAIISLILHTKNKIIRWKIAIKYILYGLAGLFIGSIIINYIDETILRKIFSVLLIIIGIQELLLKPKE